MKKKLIASALALTTIIAAQAQELLPYQNENLPIEQRVEDALSRMTLKEKCRMSYEQSKFTSPGCPR